MLPGPTLVRRCPACEESFAEFTIASGNTFGATFWTDGKCEAPMLPDQPWLAACPHCRALCWLSDVPVIREEDESKGIDVPPLRVPTTRDYLNALASGLAGADGEKTRYLRVRAWWAANDRMRRARRAQPAPLSRPARANLSVLFDLLDDADENQRLMKAEAARELGRFDDAARLLAMPFSEELQEAAARLAGLVRARQRAVAKF